MLAVADLPLVAAGKVRELYALDGDLLLVASDRISTYDAVHPTEIPDKGAVLTGLSAFWFWRTAALVPNHLLGLRDGVPPALRGRAMRVRRLEMLPLECVVRGHLAGSGWTDYQRDGAIGGTALPPGLREADALPEPIFTPATKAADGEHDETVDLERAAALVGDRGLVERLRELSLALFRAGAAHARTRGLILADTKFEFGRDAEGRLTLGDELLTPDSSRLWSAAEWTPGRPQRSWDKQPVRDWAAATGWDRRPPAPALPDDVVAATSARYREAYERLTGEPLQRLRERVAP